MSHLLICMIFVVDLNACRLYFFMSAVAFFMRNCWVRVTMVASCYISPLLRVEIGR